MTETALYDVVIPPGVPQKVLVEIVKRWPNAEVIESRHQLSFANMDGDERDLIAFRADLETAQAIEQYVYEQLRDFIGEEE
jgi:hypothetical protein